MRRASRHCCRARSTSCRTCPCRTSRGWRRRPASRSTRDRRTARSSSAWTSASPELKTSDIKGRNPFADKRVRQAMNMSIDREAIKRAVMRGQSVPAGMLAPPFVNGYTEGAGRRSEGRSRRGQEAAGGGRVSERLLRDAALPERPLRLGRRHMPGHGGHAGAHRHQGAARVPVARRSTSPWWRRSRRRPSSISWAGACRRLTATSFFPSSTTRAPARWAPTTARATPMPRSTR